MQVHSRIHSNKNFEQQLPKKSKIVTPFFEPSATEDQAVGSPNNSERIDFPDVYARPVHIKKISNESLLFSSGDTEQHHTNIMTQSLTFPQMICPKMQQHNGKPIDHRPYTLKWTRRSEPLALQAEKSSQISLKKTITSNLLTEKQSND